MESQESMGTGLIITSIALAMLVLGWPLPGNHQDEGK
jgi:hypothetical protein